MKMFAYYVRTALLGLRKQPVLSLLMVLAIGVGVATAMTALTIMHRLGTDPIPNKSDRLFALAIDNWRADKPYDERNGQLIPPEQLTYMDAMALLAAAKGTRQVAMYRASYTVQSGRDEARPFRALARVTSADFFAMFNTPFAFGGGWSAADDLAATRSVVLSRETNERLFGGENSVGQVINLSGDTFTVIGVLDRWHPQVKFYDVNNGATNEPEQLYLPLSHAVAMQQYSDGNVNCYESPGDGWERFVSSECVWMQGWVELGDQNAVDAYRAFIAGYIAQQKAAGRAFARPQLSGPIRLLDWLTLQRVVPSDVRLFTVLGFAFLLVCVLNAGSLLLAKFLRRAGEIGLRRAIGASKRALFAQFLTEAAVVGTLGAAVGLALTIAGLAGFAALIPDSAAIAKLDLQMFMTCVAVAVFGSVLAGIYPAMRASSVVPAAQLKTN